MRNVVGNTLQQWVRIMSYHNVQLQHTVIKILKTGRYYLDELVREVQKEGMTQNALYQKEEIVQILKYLKSLNLVDKKSEQYTWKGWS